MGDLLTRRVSFDDSKWKTYQCVLSEKTTAIDDPSPWQKTVIIGRHSLIANAREWLKALSQILQD